MEDTPIGCDIHGPWVITRADDSSYCVAEFNWHRNYAVFALVADVRNEGGEFEPIDEPRGYPVEWMGSAKSRLDGHIDSSDCHSASWLSTDEVIEAQRRYVQADDGDQTPSSDMMHAIMFMRGYEQEWKTKGVAGEIRLVFCFDD